MDKFSVEKNIKLYRIIQNIISPNIISENKYNDYDLDGIKVRVFDQFQSKNIIIYIHGGGFASGSIDTYSNICYKLAVELNSKVIAIDYRLAPEYPYPAGLNDCYKVINMIMDNVDDWNKVSLIGDSAGGNLAFAVSLMGLYNKTFRVGNIVLIYPAVQTDYSLNTKFKSVLENEDESFLTRKHLEEYMNMYLPKKEDKDDLYVNLLKAKKLFGLPKTMIITGSKDPLHDEGVYLAKKLKRHLVSVKHYDIKNAKHGYFTNVLDKKYTKITIELIKGFIGD